MLKQTELTIGLAVVVLVISGLVWFNISPIWTYLFTGVPEIATQVYQADKSETEAANNSGNANDFENAGSIQALFRLVYIVVGAGLTAFALFVSLADYLLERRQIKVSLAAPRVLHRH